MRLHPAVKTIGKIVAFGALIAGLSACSSTRHGANGSGYGDNGMGGGAGGAYAEGYGGSGGFQPGTSCNAPGGNTQSYYFDFNSNDVHSQDLARIQSQGQRLAANRSPVNVVGNTDARGSREYNVALGYRRANAISTALKQAGVSNVTTNSNGAEKPIAYGSSEDDYQCNRRVDVAGN